MTGERRTRGKRLPWLALIWLGAFLMLGALALPARAAAGGFVTPVDPNAPGREDAAGQVRTALAAQGYAVTNVGLSDDGLVAGVIMQPTSRTLDAAAWQQVRAGWQALAETYPRVTWLLSGYTAGDRYLVCFLVPQTALSSFAGQMGVYDTLLGRWVQRKDFAHKDFGASARWSEFLSPIPGLALDTEPPAAATDASPDDFSDQSAGLCFLPSLDQITNHIAINRTLRVRTEGRRRWLADPESAPTTGWRVASASSTRFTASSPDLLCWSRAPAVPCEVLIEARWCKRAYPADSEPQDADEDPAGEPPPATRPLLSPRPTSNTFPSLHASFLLTTCPDPAAHLGIGVDATSPAPQYLLAWPTLRVRPPPQFAS